MATRPITDELVQQVIEDLRARYALDAEDVQEIGVRLAGDARSRDNVAFAEGFMAEHPSTFDRLAR